MLGVAQRPEVGQIITCDNYCNTVCNTVHATVLGEGTGTTEVPCLPVTCGAQTNPPPPQTYNCPSNYCEPSMGGGPNPCP